MRFIFFALIFSLPVFAESNDVAQMQTCLNAIGRENFKVVGFSRDTDTLYYEINARQLVVLQKDSAFEVQTDDVPVCKPVDRGNFEKFADQLAENAIDKIKSGRPGAAFTSCVASIKTLGFPALAGVVEAHIKNTAPKSNSVQPAPKMQ